LRQVTIYLAPGCHLCEQALDVLEQLRRAVPFDLNRLDITADPRLHRAYLERIPVIELDGEELSEYFVDEQELLRRLRERPT
jgi:hypothetical protein